MAEPVIETQSLTKDYWLGVHVVHALRGFARSDLTQVDLEGSLARG